MRIAIIGSGQLAMMLAKAGLKLGFSFSFLANPDEDVKSVVGLGVIVRKFPDDSAEDIFERLGRPQVTTIEKEQVDVAFLREFEKLCLIHPNVDAIKTLQDRIKEKRFLTAQKIPVARHRVIEHFGELQESVKDLRLPLFTKHPKLGYDGKSQWKIVQQSDIYKIPLVKNTFPLILEEKVDFLYEASIIGIRSLSGETKFYPATKNFHKDGILIHSSLIQSHDEGSELIPLVQQYVNNLLSFWDYAGVLAIELFVTEDGIVVNELAPRVHNSGHWTMDGCQSSQFENHIRAIVGMPLGETKANHNVSMINLIGVDKLPLEIKHDSHNVYWYNKTLRPNRKMGHINVRGKDINELQIEKQRIVNKLYQVNY